VRPPSQRESSPCPFCQAPAADRSSRPTGFGERAAMRVASVIASWRFAAALLTCALAWVTLNITILPISPFPMVMIGGLGAGLSLLAALYGPVLLLTQRFEAAQDRARSRAILSAALAHERILEGDDQVFDHERIQTQRKDRH
jgi:uncharacterized membrane protein